MLHKALRCLAGWAERISGHVCPIHLRAIFCPSTRRLISILVDGLTVHDAMHEISPWLALGFAKVMIVLDFSFSGFLVLAY